MGKYCKPLAGASVLYLLSASVGTVLAIQRHLPANFGGFLHGHDVVRDFLALNGTALSAPLAFLILQALFTTALARPDRLGLLGSMGLTVMGALYVIAQAGEPIVLRMFNPTGFDLTQAIVLMVNLFCSAGMLAFGVLEWRSRRTAITETATHAKKI